ncbi:MAG: YcbK family protein [Rhizobiaceae bacterium]|nr:YcbK family protein [Rhizobiaceae bacterium]
MAACSSTADPPFGATIPSFSPTGAATQMAAVGPGDTVNTGGDVTASDDSVDLPETVAYLPKPNGAGPEAAAIQPAEAVAAAPAAETPAPAASSKPALDNPVYVTAADPVPVETVSPKKRSLLSSLFGTTPAEAAPIIEPERPVKPLVELASASGTKTTLSRSVFEEDANPLPGVRQTALFEIRRKSGIDDDSDVDLNEEDDSYQVASAGGLARLAPNGLLKQTENVDVSCLKPSLVRVLKSVERRYGKQMIVTSGYRNPERNRRARGAKNSLHMYCAAADVQVPGVSKWELAKFVRSMPGRGGVGTYCHTESVHIDVGPERDWNWRCRRRKG